MISETVESEESFYSRLRAEGLEPTTERTATGTLWKHTKSGKHIIVPDSIDGFYPRWLTGEMWDMIRNLPSIH